VTRVLILLLMVGGCAKQSDHDVLLAQVGALREAQAGAALRYEELNAAVEESQRKAENRVDALKSGSVLAELKATPSSKFDVGALAMEVVAITLTPQLYGKRAVDGMNFNFWKFSTDDSDNQLVWETYLVGPAKEVNEKTCISIRGKLKGTPLRDIAEDLWPDLPEARLDRLVQEEFHSRVILVVAENQDFQVRC
jgi:hypothetical protein